MTLIPIDDDDVAAGRALRAEFARFWSTEQGDPRTVYDRFIAATPVAADVAVQHVSADPGPGIWVRPVEALPDRVLLFLHGGGYGLGSAPAYAGLVSQIAVRDEGCGLRARLSAGAGVAAARGPRRGGRDAGPTTP